jgi:energy-converting hydrogenase B subunit D
MCGIIGDYYMDLNYSLIIDVGILLLVVLSYIGALVQKDLIKCVVLTGLGGLGLAYIFSSLLAPDVALTEAILGGAVLPAFFAFTVKRTQRMDE